MKAYSPILADRLAISASAGIPKIVDEIKIAAAVARRKDEIARDAATAKIRTLVQTVAEKREAERLGNSEKGAQLVMSSTKHLFDEIERIIKTGVGDSAAREVRIRSADGPLVVRQHDWWHVPSESHC